MCLHLKPGLVNLAYSSLNINGNLTQVLMPSSTQPPAAGCVPAIVHIIMHLNRFPCLIFLFEQIESVFMQLQENGWKSGPSFEEYLDLNIWTPWRCTKKREELLVGWVSFLPASLGRGVLVFIRQREFHTNICQALVCCRMGISPSVSQIHFLKWHSLLIFILTPTHLQPWRRRPVIK